MNLNLSGKSVIVTGGGSNIGRAISLAFAKEGVHLTVAEIDEGQGGRWSRRPRARRRLGHARADRRDPLGVGPGHGPRGRGPRGPAWTSW